MIADINNTLRLHVLVSNQKFPDVSSEAALADGLAVAEVDLVFMPEGSASTDVTYTGSAIVDSISRSAGVDGMIEAAFSFTGTGLLVKGAVS